MELKVTKANAINISSHQVAWNYAYCMSGGVSFFLVHPLSSPHLYLFGGVYGRELLKSGLRGVDLGSGLGIRPLWSGDNESGLVVGLLEAARGLPMSHLQSRGHRSESGSSRHHRSWSGRESGSEVPRPPWPGPGV